MTGSTAVVAETIQLHGLLDPKQALEVDKGPRSSKARRTLRK